MPEIYDDGKSLLGFPSPSDYSLELRQIIYYFSRKYRNHCTSCVNRFIFSYDNDFFCIMPIRSQFRVIGRVDMFTPVKRTKFFDVYCIGDFDTCVSKFRSMVRDYGLYFS